VFLNEVVSVSATCYGCEFALGDGTGSKENEVKVGIQTGEACIKACVERKKNDQFINGVTVRRDGSGGCWCEREMTKRDNDRKYKSCFLVLKSTCYGCEFALGDGMGSAKDNEVKVGIQTGEACIAACVERKKIDHFINGVTVRRDGSGGCWCERVMARRDNDPKYKSCFLVPKSS